MTNWVPTVLGMVLGAGVMLCFIGLRRMTNQQLEDAERKKGYWPLNGGLILIALSIYYMG